MKLQKPNYVWRQEKNYETETPFEPEHRHFYALTYPVGIANVELQQESDYDRPTFIGQRSTCNGKGGTGEAPADLASS
jgi:hypothetical protein